MPFRFHIPGLPHTVTNKKYIHCAFTQKVYKLCAMLFDLGHEVYHYGCEGSNPKCTEQIDVIDNDFRLKFYPDDWHEKHWDYNTEDECHEIFYKRTIAEITTRVKKRDFLLCMWGFGHKKIADAFANRLIVVEPGIGYKHTFSKYRVFESYNWMSYIYGYGTHENGKRKIQEDGNNFDAVIPNYFDPDDFIFCPDEKEDYFLYLGRIIPRKGINIAVETVQKVEGHLKIAGQGKFVPPPPQGNEIIEHVGFADVQSRKPLLAKAKALLMPTIYIEPFGGVAVEAMMSGTPVISTDWGVFSETVLHGITGYRCRTLDHFVWAARNIGNISPKVCRKWACSNFNMTRVAQMYQEYFEMLYTLWSDGWYMQNPKRHQLEWLNKQYPATAPKSLRIKKNAVNPLPDTILPIEQNEDYALDLRWYTAEKQKGISFLLRAKNEERTIGMALDSLQHLSIPYEVNIVLNQCNDSTKDKVLQRKRNGQNIHIYEYPFQLGKTGLENYCTPVVSLHSTIWLLNWMLTKGAFSYTLRWDADFIMTAQLAQELDEVIRKEDYKICNISALFSDTGRPNTEPYLWANSQNPRYVRYSLWHLTKFGKPSKNIGYLKGRIIHDSPLETYKAYWKTDPWWESEPESEIAQKSKKKYNDILTKLNGKYTTLARASCPESDKLAEAIQKLGGADIDEIPRLRAFTRNV